MRFDILDIIFDPSNVGLGAIIAVVGGVIVLVVRFFVDRPRNAILRQDVEDLKVSRDDSRAERVRLEAELHETKLEAAAAKELATNRAKVDELFAYIKDLVIQGQPRQEKLMTEIATLGRGLMEAVASGHDLRGQLSQRIEQMELKQAQEHRGIADALSQNTVVLREIHETIQGQIRWDGRHDRREGR